MAGSFPGMKKYQREHCILGSNIGVNGYSRMPSGRRGRSLYAHRVVYQEHVGPIPDDHDVHHACGTKACVNPTHLIVLTHGEHSRLQANERCPRCGASEWVYYGKDRQRRCRACARQRQREYRAR